MCWCTPEIRTPCCGKPECVRPQDSPSKSACSTVIENCAAILYHNDTPDCQTISSQEKAIAVIHRLLGELRQGSRESHPRAAIIYRDLEIGLQEVLATLRNAKAIVRSIHSLDP